MVTRCGTRFAVSIRVYFCMCLVQVFVRVWFRMMRITVSGCQTLGQSGNGTFALHGIDFFIIIFF